jgi:hypothetical protein
MSVRARHVLCFTGSWSSLDDVAAIVREVGGSDFRLDRKYSVLEPDPRMGEAFEASADRISRSFGDDDRAAVAAHSAVAYVLSPRIEAPAAIDVSARALKVVAAMLSRGGAKAAKGESAGIAHGKARWLELAEQAEGDTVTRLHALRLAWVRRPLLDESPRVYYSCGMHLLGDADVEVRGDLEPLDAVRWIDAFLGYLVLEKPSRPVQEGETFRLSRDDAPHILRARPCTSRYEEDEFFFNPHGYWSLVEKAPSA